MRSLRNCFIALVLGCLAPILIWVGAGVALNQRRKEANLAKRALPELSCSFDADCPPEYVCIGGRCVLKTQS